MKKISKQSLTKLLALGILVGGTTGALAIQQASADEVSQDADQGQTLWQGMGRHGHPPQMGPDFMQNVTRSVEKIDNGVVITLTTDDADTLQKLQEREDNFDPDKAPDFMQNVTRSVVQLDNGVQITLTSDDEATVQKLQEGPLGGGSHQPMDMSKVTRSVENIENGVVITLTSDDADTVQELQDHMSDQQ